MSNEEGKACDSNNSSLMSDYFNSCFRGLDGTTNIRYTFASISDA